MADDLTERIERLCERLGLPEPMRSRFLRRFEEGREEFGAWNHLSLTPEYLAENAPDELADWWAYHVAIPWSQVRYALLIDGAPVTVAEDEADAAVDREAAEAFIEFLSCLPEGENGG